MEWPRAARDVESGLRPTWVAVVWAECLLVLGGALVVVAVINSVIRICLDEFGCDDTSSGGDGWVLLGIVGLGCLVAAPYLAARRSGQRSPGLMGTVALAALAGAFVLGPALAVTLAGCIAIRMSSRAALLGRAVLVVVFTVVTLIVSSELGAFAFAALALPAIGVADTVALRLEEGRES